MSDGEGGKDPPDTQSGDSESELQGTSGWQDQLADVVKSFGPIAVAVFTASGFVIGAVAVKLFAEGLGVPVTDLGLDIRGCVTVAAGTLVFPALLAILGLLGAVYVSVAYPLYEQFARWDNRRGGGDSVNVPDRVSSEFDGNMSDLNQQIRVRTSEDLNPLDEDVLTSLRDVPDEQPEEHESWWARLNSSWALYVARFFLIGPFMIGWWFAYQWMLELSFGRESVEVATWVSGVGVWGSGFLAVLVLKKRPKSTRLSMSVAVSGILLVSFLLTVSSSYAWGDAVLEGRDSGRGPAALEFVLPLSQGVISVDDRTACVDRVGRDVVIGTDGLAVLTDWNWFKIQTCKRDPLGTILDDE